MNRKRNLKSQMSILGTRIRQRRREIGLTQRELARRVGISASYLNLIEWNRRQIAGARLRRIAEALDLPLDDLGGLAERRLAEDLAEIARLPSLDGFGIEEERIGELIGRFPGWSRALAALARSEREAMARVGILSDRLSNDPFLGETVHRMLSRIAAIRSAAEILTEYTDIPADRRDRFSQMIHEESATLSGVGEALAVYLDKAEDTDRVLTPIDEVEAVFAARGEDGLDLVDGRKNAVGVLGLVQVDGQGLADPRQGGALLVDHLREPVPPIGRNVGVLGKDFGRGADGGDPGKHPVHCLAEKRIVGQAVGEDSDAGHRLAFGSRQRRERTGPSRKPSDQLADSLLLDSEAVQRGQARDFREILGQTALGQTSEIVERQVERLGNPAQPRSGDLPPVPLDEVQVRRGDSDPPRKLPLGQPDLAPPLADARPQNRHLRLEVSLSVHTIAPPVRTMIDISTNYSVDIFTKILFCVNQLYRN